MIWLLALSNYGVGFAVSIVRFRSFIVIRLEGVLEVIHHRQKVVVDDALKITNFDFLAAIGLRILILFITFIFLVGSLRPIS